MLLAFVKCWGNMELVSICVEAMSRFKKEKCWARA